MLYRKTVLSTLALAALALVVGCSDTNKALGEGCTDSDQCKSNVCQRGTCVKGAKAAGATCTFTDECMLMCYMGQCTGEGTPDQGTPDMGPAVEQGPGAEMGPDSAPADMSPTDSAPPDVKASADHSTAG